MGNRKWLMDNSRKIDDTNQRPGQKSRFSSSSGEAFTPAPAARCRRKKRAGRTLEGRTWDEMPVSVGLVKA